MKIYKSAASDGNNWAEVTANQTFAAVDYQNAVQMGDQLYILSDGKVYASADAVTWNQVGEDSQLKQLVGASSKYLYAFTATGIAVSKDNGATWTAQKMDADFSLLPTQNLSMNVSTIASVKHVENVLLLGTRDASYRDTIATLWNHVADYSPNAPESTWNYILCCHPAHPALRFLPRQGQLLLGSKKRQRMEGPLQQGWLDQGPDYLRIRPSGIYSYRIRYRHEEKLV